MVFLLLMSLLLILKYTFPNASVQRVFRSICTKASSLIYFQKFEFNVEIEKEINLIFLLNVALMLCRNNVFKRQH